MGRERWEREERWKSGRKRRKKKGRLKGKEGKRKERKEEGREEGRKDGWMEKEGIGKRERREGPNFLTYEPLSSAKRRMVNLLEPSAKVQPEIHFFTAKC